MSPRKCGRSVKRPRPSCPPRLRKEGLYDAFRKLTNHEFNLKDPSGSQDMIGLIYPGINRLDYDFRHDGGIFPRHIESNHDPVVAEHVAWARAVQKELEGKLKADEARVVDTMK